MIWTSEKIEILRRMWSAERTAADISIVLRTTRNSVIGKAARLKLERRDSPIKRGVSVQSKAFVITPSRYGTPSKRRIEHSKIALTAYGETSKLIDLKPDQCRWPIGDPKQKGFHFCGGKKTKENYCDKHHSIAYTRSK